MHKDERRMFFGYILEIQNVIVLFINSSILGVMIEIIKDLNFI